MQPLPLDQPLASAGPDGLPKERFDIDEVFRRLRAVCAHLPEAALFDLRDRGFGSPFEQLVAGVISIRTRDETTLPVSLKLFERARTPEQMLQIPEEDLCATLGPVIFPEAKVGYLRGFSRQILDQFGGRVPDTAVKLESLPGVGPKVANLVLGIAFGQPAIAVDVHVHRVTNRWGYASAATPAGTETQLRERLPRRYWVEINERLVPFGKFVCTGASPRCGSCPLLSQCRQVGVERHR